MNTLVQLRDTLNKLPSEQQLSLAKSTINDLEKILEDNPSMRRLAAVPGRPKTGRKSRGRIDEATVQAVLVELQGLPERELRGHLQQDRRYSRDMLRAILQLLGRKLPARATKQQLIDAVINGITAQRTYRGIRDVNGLS